MKNFELIKITERNGKRAVSARELHLKLGVGKDFSSWIKSRIDKYEFIENQDFEVFPKIGENSQGGRPTIEYALSLDMAKELCMVENSERGRTIRKYFIECEKIAREGTLASYQIEDPIERAERWIAEQREKKRLEAKVAEDAPKVTFANAIIGSKKNCLVGELAKILTQNGYRIGQNRLFDWLREHGFLGKSGEYYNIPNQKYIEQGLFELKKGVRSGNDGVIINTITTTVTPKGQQYFILKLLHS